MFHENAAASCQTWRLLPVLGGSVLTFLTSVFSRTTYRSILHSQPCFSSNKLRNWNRRRGRSIASDHEESFARLKDIRGTVVTWLSAVAACPTLRDKSIANGRAGPGQAETLHFFTRRLSQCWISSCAQTSSFLSYFFCAALYEKVAWMGGNISRMDGWKYQSHGCQKKAQGGFATLWILKFVIFLLNC